MQCPNCKAPNEDDAMFCGTCGKQLAPLYGRSSSATEISHSPPPQQGFQGPPSPAPGYNSISAFPMQPNPISPFPPTYEQAPAGTPTTPQQPGQRSPFFEATVGQSPQRPMYDASTISPTPQPPARIRNKGIAFLSIIVAICLIGIAVGVFALIQNQQLGNHPNTEGTSTSIATGNNGKATISFIDTTDNVGKTNAVTVTLTGLDALPTGSHYVAWIIDEADEKSLKLGEVLPNGKEQTLSPAPPTNLIAQGNALEITREAGDVNNIRRPSTTILLKAAFPPLAFVHIGHILAAFPGAISKNGLLVSVLQQTTLLHDQAETLKDSIGNTNKILCIARNINYLLNGKNTAQGQGLPLPAFCAGQQITPVGDGQGLLGDNGYVALAANHANLAATRPDSKQSPAIVPHAANVQHAMDRITDRLESIKQDAQDLLNNPNSTAKITDIHELADSVLNGTDANDNGIIEPTREEAGAITGYQEGQLMAQLTLVPVKK